MSDIPATIAPAVGAFKASVQRFYGGRLAGVLLYGSYARGEARAESDVDVMVLLHDDTVDTYRELREVTTLENDTLLAYGIPISPLPVALRRFQTSALPVYQQARLEGIWV